MALPWVRLDTAFPTNPKILTLAGDKKFQSITVYISGLAYAGSHGTDGFLPTSALPFLHGTKRNGTDLVAIGLWIPCPGGYEINDWAEFQQSNEEHQERKRKARLAAELRWSKAREAKGVN